MKRHFRVKLYKTFTAVLRFLTLTAWPATCEYSISCGESNVWSTPRVPHGSPTKPTWKNFAPCLVLKLFSTLKKKHIQNRTIKTSSKLQRNL